MKWLLLLLLLAPACTTPLPPQTEGNPLLAQLVLNALQPDQLGQHRLVVVYDDHNSFDYQVDQRGHLTFWLTIERQSTNARTWMDAPVGAYHDWRQQIIQNYAQRIRQLLPPPSGLTEEELESVLDELFPQTTMVVDGQTYHIARYETADGYVEELVVLPEGAELADYAPLHFRQPPEVEVEQKAFSWLSLTPGFLVLNIEFGEFRDLLPAPRYYEPVIAQNGETELRPVKQPGILARTAEVVRENPGKSLTAGVLAADLLYDGKVNLFGLVGNDDGGGGTNISVGGDATIVVGDQHTDTRDQSNRPQTAQPHFPPAE